jgi:2-methylisocitrate lyase-like PEP mutase family enzyme
MHVKIEELFRSVARTRGAKRVLKQPVDRAVQFTEAGADILFVEPPEALEEVRALTKLLERPQLINIVIGGKTPALDEA